ncbi:MAG: ABC transporter substrate-binding protein [Actinobacteria bacterium]|nr:ABC transporter substrate-binding protein [Actinomycetota bacterium]
MKKLLIIVTFTIIVFSLCSSVFASGVKIDFWYALGGEGGKVFAGLIEEFNQSQSEVVINGIYSGTYHDTATKVIAAIASETLPQGGIIPAGPLFTGAYENYKILDYIEKYKFDLNRFYPGTLDYSKFNGKICVLPFNISTPILYYNKELFKKVGLDPDRPPQTWEELKEYGKKLTLDTDNDGNTDIWGLNIKSIDWLFKAFVLQNNGKIMNEDSTKVLFNSPEGIEALEYWKSLTDEGIMPVGLHDLAEKHFLAGNVGIYLDSSVRLGKWYGQLDFDFGTGFLPKNKIYAMTMGGATAALFPSTPEKEEATWKFIEWLMSTDNIVKWCINTGYIPTTQDALESEEIQQLFEEKPQYKAAFEQLKYVQSYEHFSAMGTLDRTFYEMLDKVEREALTPEEALKEAAEIITEDMQQ